MQGDPTDPSDAPRRPSSGWRWSDDILVYRVKVVAGMAVAAAVALILYMALRR